MRPLIDLHLDLEGSAPPALIRSLARAQGNDISGLFGSDGAFRPPADGGFRKPGRRIGHNWRATGLL